MRTAVFIMLVVGTAVGAMMPSRPAKSPTAEETPKVKPVKWGVTGPPDYSAQPSESYASASRSSYTAGGETVIHRDADGHFIADAQVNGASIRFLVDTGADMVALSEADARRAGIYVSPSDYRVIGRGASGDVRGMPVVLDHVMIGGKRVTGVHGAVIEDLDVSLLGQSYLRQIGSVELSGDTMRLR